jgi:glyoxylase I family protein
MQTYSATEYLSDEGGPLAPRLVGFSHVSLSVSDREASAAWYGTVFGFEVLEHLQNERLGFREIVLQHPLTGMVLCLQQHDANPHEQFDPRRTGLDHLAFKVASRAELDRWAERLAALGVTQSSIADMQYGSVLCLRDPDQVQLELFYRRGH